MAYTITDYPRYLCDGSGRDFYIHHNNGGLQGRHSVDDFQGSLRSSQKYQRYAQGGVIRLPRLDFRDREVAKRQRALSKWLSTPRTQRGLNIAVTDTLRTERAALAQSGSLTSRSTLPRRVVDKFGFSASELPSMHAPVSPRRAAAVLTQQSQSQAQSQYQQTVYQPRPITAGVLETETAAQGGYSQHTKSSSMSSTSSFSSTGSAEGSFATLESPRAQAQFQPRPPPRPVAMAM